MQMQENGHIYKKFVLVAIRQENLSPDSDRRHALEQFYYIGVDMQLTFYYRYVPLFLEPN